MPGAEPPAAGDAIPLIDAAARALAARRLHHRQIIRQIDEEGRTTGGVTHVMFSTLAAHDWQQSSLAGSHAADLR